MPNERSVDSKPSVPFACLPRLLEHQAQRIPDAPAILSPRRTPLTYRRLCQHIDGMERTLRNLGRGHRERAAVVQPKAQKKAVKTLTVAPAAAAEWMPSPE